MTSSLREPLTAGVIGGIVSAVAAGMLNHFVIPFPASPAANTIGHCVDAFVCAFAGGFIGIVLHERRSRQPPRADRSLSQRRPGT